MIAHLKYYRVKISPPRNREAHSFINGNPSIKSSRTHTSRKQDLIAHNNWYIIKRNDKLNVKCAVYHQIPTPEWTCLFSYSFDTSKLETCNNLMRQFIMWRYNSDIAGHLFLHIRWGTFPYWDKVFWHFGKKEEERRMRFYGNVYLLQFFGVWMERNGHKYNNSCWNLNSSLT